MNLLLLTLWAQLPTLPGSEPPPPPARFEEAVETATVASNDKSYDRPAPRPLPEGPVEEASGPIHRLVFDGMVNPGMGHFIIDGIETAESEKAQLVLLEIDTPGGLVSTTQDIVQALLSSQVPVVAWVTPSGAHAASAGTFITLAAHVAVMAPATRIGAAHPVTGSGQDPEAAGGKHMARKIENDLLAMVEGVAKARGRNAEWAKDAVRDSVSADAEKALEIGVVDLVARDRTQLFEALEGRVVVVGDRKLALHPQGAEIVERTPSLRDQLLNLLASPGIAVLLGVLGFLGIIVEIYSPGLIAPGVLGVLALLCSLVAVEQLPIDVGGVLFMLAGVGLLVAEFYTPSFGALGFLGVGALGLGSVLFIDLSDPNYDLDPSFALDIWDVLPSLLLVGGFIIWLSSFVVRRKRAPSATGMESMVGRRARVLRPVDGSGGQVFVEGEYWRARSKGARFESASTVEVVEVDGMTLVVDAAD
ncbi:MAG: nodulation protein NfeD [Myxococcota bacterium]